jgi:hypothetical protein
MKWEGCSHPSCYKGIAILGGSPCHLSMERPWVADGGAASSYEG